MEAHLGEFAALIGSVLIAGTSTSFTLAGRKVGSNVVNHTRLVFAVLFLLSLHLLFRIPFPIYAGKLRWFWFAVSGIIGLALGDAFLFQAFIWIGPRLSMLLMALAPAFSAIMAWVFLGEVLSAIQIFGITLTLAGIAWVILDKRGRHRPVSEIKDNYIPGIFLGLCAATCQAIGMVTAKPGLADNFPAISGTLLRMTAAATVLWSFTFLRGRAGAKIQALKAQPKALPLILVGTLTGPVLAVTLNLFAIQRAAVGVASTLMALTPIILLPIGYFFFQERFGRQAVFGTLLAFSGVALLFIA